MTTTIKNAADDAAFITALMALQEFNNKVYIKATPTDAVYTKADADTAFVQTLGLTNMLKTEVVKPDVVDAIFDAKDGNTKISETKIGTTFAKKTDLNNKADADGTNLDNDKVNSILDKLNDKVVKTSELPAKVIQSDVVTALVPVLAAGNDAFAKVDGSNATDPGVNAMPGTLTGNNVVVKVPALATKVNVDGTNASAIVTALASNSAFTDAVKINAAIADTGFQGAVRGVMSQPVFDIPADSSTPISVDW